MRKAKPSDKSSIIDILTLAFLDNKSVNYVVKQDPKRVERIKGLMGYSFNVCQAFGAVWMSDDERAVALVLYPETKRSSFHTLLWDLKLACSVIGITRVAAVLKRESIVKANHPKGSIAYLWFIGVDPGVQGRGVGTALLQEVIQDCEKQNRPVYLETSMERNFPFYRRLGFKIFQSLQLSYTLHMFRKE